MAFFQLWLCSMHFQVQPSLVDLELTFLRFSWIDRHMRVKPPINSYSSCLISRGYVDLCKRILKPPYKSVSKYYDLEVAPSLFYPMNILHKMGIRLPSYVTSLTFLAVCSYIGTHRQHTLAYLTQCQCHSRALMFLSVVAWHSKAPKSCPTCRLLSRHSFSKP